MTPVRRLPWWPALVLAVVGLAALYADALRTGFLCDDHLFLEQARTEPWLRSLTHLGALGNYYRPLSRQLFFEILTPVAAYRPLVFHVANAALFATSIVLLLDLLVGFAPLVGAVAGALYFALLPLQGVNLIWISCSQDLLALTLGLAAFACFRRGRDAWGCLAWLGALASKETAFPLPLAMAAWLALRPAAMRDSFTAIGRRLLPFALTGAAWLAWSAVVRARDHAVGGLRFTLEALAATWVHATQSLIGLDQPVDFMRGLMEHGPSLVALASFVALAPWIARWRRDPGTTAQDAWRTRNTVLFGLAWIAMFALPAGPVVHTWSSYYYTLSAVGAAILVALVCRSLDGWSWAFLVAALLWIHAAVAAAPVRSISDRTWGWTTHLNVSYFRRAADLSERLASGLHRSEPKPPPGTRFFFATLPPNAAFQMGNGALIRELYRDPTLASYFYSQFSESTAADRPCRFLYWDGVAFEPLYRGSASPWFQVGADLFLFGHPAGAAHAFRRGLVEGEGREDHLYWLGWAEFLTGDRPRAEASWRSFGAVDDTARYHRTLMRASNALLARDTTLSRRLLFEAIHAGIGRPEAHAALGRLLESRQLKYGLMELQVASFLDPRDFLSRRHLIAGLVEVRLDEAARRELDALMRVDPAWRRDPALVAAKAVLDSRSGAGPEAMEF